MEENSTPSHIVTILAIENVTHNVKRFSIQKPEGYSFVPGQATEIAINLPDWKSERRPFTFTSLNEWDHLEFTIKIYADHDGVTNQLGKLSVGDELILHDVWGAIQYKGEGVFIAGGAGITPFIAILRQLYHDGKIGGNQLLFSNKTSKDIILKEELEKILGKNFTNTLTNEKNEAYDHEKMDIEYLRKKIKTTSSYFYICGPDPMVEGISKDLESLGILKDMIVIEQF